MRAPRIGYQVIGDCSIGVPASWPVATVITHLAGAGDSPACGERTRLVEDPTELIEQCRRWTGVPDGRVVYRSCKACGTKAMRRPA